MSPKDKTKAKAQKTSSSSPMKAVKWNAAMRRAWTKLKGDERFRGLLVFYYLKQQIGHRYARA